MRLLIDSSAWGGMVSQLQQAGHDVIQVADVWKADPGDITILDYAFSEARIIVTRDKDFGEFAIHQGNRHCGIIRLWDTPARLQADVVLAVLTQCHDALAASAIITASPYRIRVRKDVTQE